MRISTTTRLWKRRTRSSTSRKCYKVPILSHPLAIASANPTYYAFLVSQLDQAALDTLKHNFSEAMI